jgi:integrase
VQDVQGRAHSRAGQDDRITNAKAWRLGLAAIPEADDTESNLVLTDQQRRDVIASAYAISQAFGLYVEAHAATGARSSQVALLNVGDLQSGAKPLLMVPSSLKGGNGRVRTRKPMPISPGLADRLVKSRAGAKASEPLLLLKGKRWNANKHRLLFADAAKAAGLPDHATAYCLRHTAITRALLAGVPVRLVASSFDTSVDMIEKTYSKNISTHGDEQMRRVALDIDAVADGNVVPLARR